MSFELFDDINSMICIMDYDTSDVVYLNRRALAHFGFAGIPAGLTQAGLFEGEDYIIAAISEGKPEPGEILTKILPAFCGLKSPVLLECLDFTVDSRRLRILSFRPVVVDGENSDSLYTMMFESAYLYIDANYHGIDFAEDNIRECLSAVFSLYDADRAYILDIDEQLEAGEYLCLFTNDGFTSSEYDSSAVLFSNLFSSIIKKGESFAFVTEALKDTHPAEYAWLESHGIFNAMGVPFRTRTGMIPFLVVDNVRRFWEKMSFLSMSTRALYNEIRAIQMLKKSVSARHGNKELWDGEIIINLFGGFEIHTSVGSLDLGDYSSLQCSKFLLYLIKNRNRTIPVREIADVLWPDQLIDNPYNMVKGVAFRVRKILDSIGTSNLVIAKAGTYAINDKLMIILDTERFDRLSESANHIKKSSFEKQSLYEKLLRIYKGDMLPNFESEIWLIGWIGYYQMKYLEILKDYLGLLQESEQYGKIFEVVSNVQRIGYGDSEICMFLIQALIRQNKQELAKSYYMRLEKYLSAEQRSALAISWDKH